jgi:hypothetical protein
MRAERFAHSHPKFPNEISFIQKELTMIAHIRKTDETPTRTRDPELRN